MLCVESGLSLNRAFERVARYLQEQHAPMAEQFRVTSAELDLLNDRTQALNNLSWRTGIPELHTLATTLTMADKYGSPLADTLRQISEDARRQRALDIEERAGKLPGKITLIQMTMIMLPMLVMVISPILSQLLTSLA
ncbi:type II secretion system F family protein [Vibrio vulnificus]|uniref:type II secretion system F family protein n=1 Tax=Vibrio vulnificus TaxID=672 RepID=UPI002811FE66|nr:type II secretion system F family protein [Vibrio vulnificus]